MLKLSNPSLQVADEYPEGGRMNNYYSKKSSLKGKMASLLAAMWLYKTSFSSHTAGKRAVSR